MHYTVLNLLKKMKPGILLDAPAGNGAVANCLSKMGFQVHCCDFYPENFQVPHLTCQKVDLNEKLPYSNSYFQYIICLESIQSLENPHLLLREFSRILRERGILILSLPNILNIQSRIKFLIRGYLPFLKPYGQLSHITNAEWANSPINPISFQEIKLILERYNYAVTTVLTSKIDLKNYFFLPLIWLIKISIQIGNLFTRD